VAARPGTVRAYAKGEDYQQPPMSEEAKKILFGQTAQSAGAAPAS
jgi:GST-like protein